MEEHADVQLLDGRRAVVRNGYLPRRELLTGIGPVEVQVPKIRDRSGAGIKFTPALAPPYVRRTPRVSAELPWLYLKGASSGDRSEALQVLLGEQAKGLSANVLRRMKRQWGVEYKHWSQALQLRSSMCTGAGGGYLHRPARTG